MNTKDEIKANLPVNVDITVNKPRYKYGFFIAILIITPIAAPTKTKALKWEGIISTTKRASERILKYFFPGSNSSFTTLFNVKPTINPKNAIIGSTNIFLERIMLFNNYCFL